MMHDSVVVHTGPRALSLAMITLRKSIHGFPVISLMSMVLLLAAPPLLTIGKR